MKKTTTAAVGHSPTTSAAMTPKVISVCEMIWRCQVARATLANTGYPAASTNATPSGQGTRRVRVPNSPNHSPTTTMNITAPKTRPKSPNTERESPASRAAWVGGSGSVPSGTL